MSGTFENVADFALELSPSDIPDSVLRAAARMTLDTLGVTIAAEPLQAARIAKDTAAAVFGCGDSGLGSRMLFDGRRASVAGAAYAGAAQTDNLDAHDGYNPTKGHIGAAVVPSFASLSETVQDMSGREALACVVVGYEIAGRAGLALHSTVSDYHTSGAWNALGVAAMAARTRSMDRSKLRQALGIAEYHGPRSQMMREIANPTMLSDGSGWGALAGVSAAVLAENGFTGAPAITVEGDEVAKIWSDLGTFWQMEHQYVKPYPICRWAHPAIDAVRMLAADRGFRLEDIERVEIATFREAACLFDGMPDTAAQAQYSLHFAVATMLVHGGIGPEHVSDEGMSDEAVSSVVKRISVAESEEHNALFPASRTAEVALRLKGGRVLESGITHARGAPENPMSEHELRDKFIDFSVPVVGRKRTGAILGAVRSLVEQGSRFSSLSDLIFDAP